MAKRTEESRNPKVNEVYKAWEEARSAFQELNDCMREDYRFYSSNQWSDADLEIALKRQAPTLTLNYIKKMADVISGFERQAPSDIKCFPIEGGDMRTAEVYSRLIKWITTDRSSNYEISRAFKDAVICGVGWIAPMMKFEKDFLSGDVEIRKVDPFNIHPDPHFKEPDLSDAQYIIKHTRMPVESLKRLFPKKAKEIEAVKGTGSFTNEGIREENEPPSDQGETALVIEYYYRDYQTKTIIVEGADYRVFEGTADELAEMQGQNPDMRVIERKVGSIKLRIITQNILLYDGDNPHDTDDFPIIPAWGYFDTSNKDWKWRVSGIIRHLKDAQREKNKRRSVLMQILSKMPQYGWIMDQNAADPDALKRGDNIIEKVPGREIRNIPPTDFPAAAIAIEDRFDQDMLRIGTSLDTLGMPQDRGEPGVVISQRIRQGLMSHQELFDNLSHSKRMLGRALQQMISRNFSQDKIRRILGQDIQIVPPGLEQQARQAAEQAEIMTAQVEAEKANLQSDLDRMEASGQEIDPETAQGVVQEINNMEMQVRQAKQQAEALVTQLAMAKAEEKQFWIDFDKTRITARFDMVIDETSNNPTYRVGTLEQLMRLVQYQMPVPFESLVELMDIPIEQKKAMIQRIQQQQQAAAEAANFEKQKESNKTQLEVRKQDMQLKLGLIQQGINPETFERIPEDQTKQ